MSIRFLIPLVQFFSVGWIVVEQVYAGDWPQILGPQRNGIASEEKIADRWPAGRPTKTWEANVGSGFAGPAVSGKIAVLFHRRGDKDELTAFHAETGEQIWTTSFRSTFRPGIVDDDGPRAVPTIQDGSIYAFSAQGVLYCVDLKTGKKRWERKTHEDFGADGGYFGAGSSPLIEGTLVIVIVGGDKKNAGVVAFHSETGKTAWSSVRDQASYSSPVAVTLNGTRHLLCLTRLNFVSLDPLTGTERFKTPFGQRGPTVNASIPITYGDHVLLTASYGIGARWLKLADSNVDVVWDDDVLSSQYTTPILHDGAAYGISGRQDQGAPTLKCFDPVTRKEFWSTSEIVYATLIGADGKLLVMQTDGILKVASMNRLHYNQSGSASLLPGTVRALPALSNGRFFVRNEKTLACFDLSK